MEWNVKNAASRDVERQHLNKILKDIRATIEELKTSGLTPRAVEQQIVTRIIQSGGGGGGGSGGRDGTGVVPAPKSFTLTFTGDVTGTGTVNNLSNTTVSLTVDPEILGVPEAPASNTPYWRQNGQWLPVDYKISTLAYLEGEGIVAYSDDTGWVAAELVAGDGIVIDVTDVTSPVFSVTDEVLSGVHIIELEAEETIHGRRAVSAGLGTAYHPDLSEPSDGIAVIGVALQAGETGDVIQVQTAGPCTNASWSWDAGPVFVDDEGVLTQTAPSTGWVVCIGKATASNTIDINVLITLLRN